MNKTYKGGVAKTKTTKNKGGKTKYKPYANSSLYEANKSKDRDKDGIACER
ncbi:MULTISPECIES: excalibur calcium-binding domain-containing protein [Exiguobacterium]|uniref:excalibur calcium-binding domain-containing protein n=1 Tax=Exiguobacterium TaxID=33986 RepID=UPI002036FCE8|nr:MULTISPECIES: excalibur calcium-binding domain-containing protein [unclassified Exiguobacterium]